MGRNLILIIMAIVLSFSLSFSEEIEKFDKNILKNSFLVDKVVAIVNGKPVLKSEVELFKKASGIKDDKEALEKLIDQILISQVAESMGISASKEVNNYILALVKKNNLKSVEELKKVLEKDGILFSEFKDYIKRQILVEKFINNYLKEKFLDAVEEGKIEKVATIRVLFLDKSSLNFKEKYNKVNSSLYKVPFSKLVKLYSDDKMTAEYGGLLKDIKKGLLSKEIDTKLWQHKKGDIFEVETDRGVYFIKVENMEKKLVSEADRKKLNKKIKKELDMLIQRLRENAVINYLE